uniref:Uncharacterized protein n=1 Tax=Onchocerca volvulus TaxID=6282 RepID=A0A8R1XTA2_ONCVO
MRNDQAGRGKDLKMHLESHEEFMNAGWFICIIRRIIRIRIAHIYCFIRIFILKNSDEAIDALIKDSDEAIDLFRNENLLNEMDSDTSNKEAEHL